MEIKALAAGDVTVLTVAGRLDTATAFELQSALLEQIGVVGRKLVLDLADLAYVSSVGLRALVLGAKKLKLIDAVLVVCCPGRTVMDVLETSGLTTVLAVVDTREEALAMVRGG